METERIKMRRRDLRNLFRTMMEKSKSKTLKELSGKLKISYGSLKMYSQAKRSIPLTFFSSWIEMLSLPSSSFTFETVAMTDVFRKASKKGIKKLKKKYGSSWNRILGKKGREKLGFLLENNKKIRAKWKKARILGLKNRFGKNFYQKMGRLGGTKSIMAMSETEKQTFWEKGFRSSFRGKIRFRNRRFRSFKEIEIAAFLEDNSIQYEYEKRLCGFYPDFFLPESGLVIEVIGFEWKPHIQRSIDKIKKFVENKHKVIIYTYPNLVYYFKNLPVSIATQKNELKTILNL